MKKKPSIKVWLMALSSAMLILVAVGDIIFGSFFARSYFMKRKSDEILSLFYYIRDEYTDSDSYLYELLRDGEDVQNISVAIFDGDGEPLYSSRPVGDPDFEPFFPNVDTVEFSSSPEVIELQEPSGADNASLVLAGTFSYEGEERRVILWVRVEAIESAIDAYNMVSLYIAVAVLALGIILSMLFARYASKPVRQVEEVSRRASELDFSMRADEGAFISELSSLAVSVNQMSQRLQDSIAELREANERLQEDVDRQRRLEKMQREFVANVSHEMKTPLCLLQIYAENLKYNVEGIDKDYYCDTIIDESRRLSEMVSGMLSLSAEENGMAKMKLSETNLGELCRETLARMEPTLGEVAVECDVRDDIVLMADGELIASALENLLNNAASHTPAGGLIRLSVEKTENNEACISVYNSGSHLPEKSLDRLWDAFYKVDEARTRDRETHIGLGLTIARSAIARHGGICTAENKDDGVSFSFIIPLR